MRWSPHQRFTIEVGLIKACNLPPLRPLGEALGRMKELEARLGARPAPSAHRVGEQPAEYRARAQAIPAPSAAQADGEQGDSWGRIMAAVKLKKPGLASALAHSRIVEITDSQIIVGVHGSSFQLELVEKRENRGLLEELAAGILNSKLSVKIQPLADNPHPAASSRKKPAPPEQDPAVQDVLKVFPQGEVIEQGPSDS
jgi:hypothetical protein